MEKSARPTKSKSFFSKLLLSIFVPDYKKVMRLYCQSIATEKKSDTEK